MVNTQDFESNVNYTTTLDNFEGPLDLLLYLVKQAQIEIKDIFVSQVTEQYLAYIKNAIDLEMEVAAEYLVMAATLVEIKSRSVLYEYEHENEMDDGLPPDGMIIDIITPEDLITQLEIYKRVSSELKHVENTGAFYKEPNYIELKTKTKWDFTQPMLIESVKKLILRISKEKIIQMGKEVKKETYTVERQINYIRRVMSDMEDGDKIAFSELFAEEVSLDEVITTFQALLELYKRRIVDCEQETQYSEIYLKPGEMRSEEIGEIDEYN